MKKVFLIIAALVLLVTIKNQARPVNVGINFGFFYSSLQPYGEWIAVDNDLYAFRPQVYNNWEPYSNGRWVWTADGWYWDSYEPFGWATFHYGRWYYDDYYGWMWLPDYQWGPSWVEWRYDDDYIGWAPLPPYAVYNINVGIRFNYDWHFPYHHWHYVNFHHFNDHNVNNYFIADKYKSRIHSRTKYRDNYDYRDGRVINRGVDKDFVERRAGARIPERELVETRSRDNNGARNGNRVEVYRPNREELEKTRNLDKFDIKRPERKIALDASKVETRTIVRNQDNNKKDVRVENSKENDRVRVQNPENRNDVKIQRPETNRNSSRVQRPEKRNDVRIQKPENRNEVRIQKPENRDEVRVQRPENRNETRVQKPNTQSNNAPRVQRNSNPEVRERTSKSPENKRNENRSSGNKERNRNSEGERRR